jgi:hypothetical protein
LQQPLEPALIESVLQELLKHHDALRLRFARGESCWQQDLANPSVVGLFVNPLPVRVKIDPQDFILSCLKELQAQQVEARQYEYSPLVEVQGWSEVPRSLPLFESLVVFENYPSDASLQEKIHNLKVENIRSLGNNELSSNGDGDAGCGIDAENYFRL